jgi:hypothetical protein
MAMLTDTLGHTGVVTFLPAALMDFDDLTARIDGRLAV